MEYSSLNNRLPWRIFGLVYAHPHPQSPDTTVIRNKDGQPLPTSLDGAFASEFLIDENEMEARRKTMQAACLNCHAASWVKGQWQRFENTIRQTNAEILTSTNIMGDKSPKSKQKNKGQKLSQANAAAKKKSNLIASKKPANAILTPKTTKKKK